MDEGSGANGRMERRAGAIAVATGVVLLVVKFAAWWLTGSAAVFSDALESIVNVIASMVALWAIRSAHRPADRTHPYGHGRFELLSAALEGAMICVAAVVIIVRAVEMLARGEIELQRLDVGLVLLVATVLANGAVGIWLMRLGATSGSPSLSADGKHLVTDAATTAAAIASLAAVRLTGWAVIDPMVAMVMGAAIGIVGVRMLRRSLGDLLDEQDPRDAASVEALLESHRGAGGREPRICSWHKLRVRHIGREHWVEFHMRVPGGTDVARAHEAASRIEEEIEALLGPGNATAHTEPCSDPECGICSALHHAGRTS